MNPDARPRGGWPLDAPPLTADDVVQRAQRLTLSDARLLRDAYRRELEREGEPDADGDQLGRLRAALREDAIHEAYHNGYHGEDPSALLAGVEQLVVEALIAGGPLRGGHVEEASAAARAGAADATLALLLRPYLSAARFEELAGPWTHGLLRAPAGHPFDVLAVIAGMLFVVAAVELILDRQLQAGLIVAAAACGVLGARWVVRRSPRPVDDLVETEAEETEETEAQEPAPWDGPAPWGPQAALDDGESQATPRDDAHRPGMTPTARGDAGESNAAHGAGGGDAS